MNNTNSNSRKKVMVIGGLLLVALGGAWLYNHFRKPTLAQQPDDNKILKDAYDNLNFELGKSIIKPSSFNFLDEIATILKDPKAANWKMIISGHTDNDGSKSFNQKLSEDRAKSVKEYLVKKGINSDRIIAIGYGMDIPIADNSTKEGREKNRRVEFKIVKSEIEKTSNFDSEVDELICKSKFIKIKK